MEKNLLQDRIEEIERAKEVSVNESHSRASKLESKLKQKTKRIQELENTIIDHFENNSRKEQSSLAYFTNTQ